MSERDRFVAMADKILSKWHMGKAEYALKRKIIDALRKEYKRGWADGYWYVPEVKPHNDSEV